MFDILKPVSEEDPCGPDLRWDDDVTRLNAAVEAIEAQGEAMVAGDEEVVAQADMSIQDMGDLCEDLLERTKDVSIAAVRAKINWRALGLVQFAASMEDLVKMIVTWPGGDDGVHPRADPDDGDLFERGAPIGRLIREVPVLASTLGWGPDTPDAATQQQVKASLKETFDTWSDKLSEPLGDSLPLVKEAWESIRALLPGEEAAPEEAEGEVTVSADGTVVAAAPAVVDAWDLLDKAFDRMQVQDRHSPSVPMLRMIISWRELGIEEISNFMKQSGVSLEQMLDSIRRMEEIRRQQQ